MQRSVWQIGTPFELVPRGQFLTGQRFEHFERFVFANRAGCDVSVALGLRQKDQAMRADFGPEGVIAERAEPFFNVIYVIEIHHLSSMPHVARSLQISDAKAA